MAHERRDHVVGTQRALELGPELDEAFELGPAVAQRSLVDRREERSARREEQEGHCAHDRDAVVDAAVARRSMPASAAACARRSRSAHQSASLSPVRYDAMRVTAITSRNTRNRSGLRYPPVTATASAMAAPSTSTVHETSVGRAAGASRRTDLDRRRRTRGTPRRSPPPRAWRPPRPRAPRAARRRSPAGRTAGRAGGRRPATARRPRGPVTGTGRRRARCARVDELRVAAVDAAVDREEHHDGGEQREEHRHRSPGVGREQRPRSPEPSTDVGRQRTDRTEHRESGERRSLDRYHGRDGYHRPAPDRRTEGIVGGCRGAEGGVRRRRSRARAPRASR